MDAATPPTGWFRTVTELRQEVANSPVFLVDGIVSSTVTMISGGPYSGKSSLTCSLAAALATGRDEWLGRAISPGQHRVGFVVTDPGALEETQERLDALVPAAGDHLLVARLDHGDSSQSWGAIGSELVARGADVLIIDNLLGAMPAGCDPSSAEHSRQYIQAMEQARSLGLTLLLVHHTNKPGLGNAGKSPLGSQLWRAWPQTSVLVRKSSESVRVLEIESNRSDTVNLTLTMSYRSGGPYFDVAKSETPTRQRSPERMDRYSDAIDLVLTEHRTEPKRSKLAVAIVEAGFPGALSTWKKDLSANGIAGKLIEWDEWGGWQRVADR